MRRAMLSSILAAMALGLCATGVDAQTTVNNCRKALITQGNDFVCKAMTQSGEQFDMDLTFTPIILSTGFTMRINGGGPIGCRCNAKKINLKKPDKVQFSAAKTFSCFASGVESGPEFSGPESFLINTASYVGLGTKKGIKKGEGIDRFGRQLVYECTRPVAQ